MRRGWIKKVADWRRWNSKVANRKGFRMRKASARLNRSKIQSSVTMSDKVKSQLRNFATPGRKIVCLGRRNFYPKAVYIFMRRHCLSCEMSFSTISDQIVHMEEVHDGDVICRRCYQAFPLGSNIRAKHDSFVHESMLEELF